MILYLPVLSAYVLITIGGLNDWIPLLDGNCGRLGMLVFTVVYWGVAAVIWTAYSRLRRNRSGDPEASNASCERDS
jgi:hypothetical protein